jgi:Mg-chelatase subunit ChlD
MKTKIATIGLFGLTLAGIWLYPQFETGAAVANPPPQTSVNPSPPNQANNVQRPRIEAVFVLDTTGSMGGLIEAAKEKIWSIASSMASAQPALEIRIGLVAYRDRGDAYVTRVVDLSADLDTLHATLMDFRADGGGDGPESVNQALHEAVSKISWSQELGVYKTIFLVGDAPPHMDYQDDVKYPASLAAAKARGIVVNAIQCGDMGDTRQEWQKIAQLGAGDYFQVAQSGGAVAVATPYDKKLAELSAKLDETRLYYGDAEEKAKKQAKMEAADKLRKEATVESQARRAVFNASKSGEANLLGGNELVDDVGSGKADLSKIERDRLPAPLQAMAPEEQKAAVEEKAKERKELQGRIEDLARQRSDYIAKEVEKAGGKKDSLDAKLFGSVRKQAEGKGLRYDASGLAY